MAYDLLFVVTDREGFRISQPLHCRGGEIAAVARRLMASIQALKIEVWLGQDRLFTYADTDALPLAA